MANRSRDTDQTMGDPSHFDLKDAIRRWRTELQVSPAVSPQDLEELEGHLHELISELKARGHGDEAAFHAAVDRLGARHELEPEFAKMNRGRIWMTRACWMVLGFLSCGFVGTLASAIQLVVTQNAWGLNAHWIGFLSEVTVYAVYVILAGGVGSFLVRHPGFVADAVRLCVRRPLLPVLGIVALSYARLPLHEWIRDVTAPGLPSDFADQMRQAAPVLTCWEMVGYWIQQVVWFSLLFWMANRLSAVEATAVEAPPVSATAGRIGEADRAIQCRVWLERGFWMIVGVQLGTFLLDMMSVWSWALYRLGTGCQINPYLLTVLVIGAQWACAYGLARLAAARVVRCGATSTRMTRLDARRPVVAVAGFALLTLGAPHLLGLLPEHWFIGSMDAYYGWVDRSIRLLWEVLPAVLLFWMARKLVRSRVQSESRLGTSDVASA